MCSNWKRKISSKNACIQKRSNARNTQKYVFLLNRDAGKKSTEEIKDWVVKSDWPIFSGNIISK